LDRAKFHPDRRCRAAARALRRSISIERPACLRRLFSHPGRFGFGSLVFHILRPRRLGRLIFANALATFALFFVLQFLDVASWVARYNVARWQNDSTRTLDVAYLDSLGASASPFLIQVAETPNRAEAHEAFDVIQARKTGAHRLVAETNWRAWQWRKMRNAQLLLAHEVRTQR
jgi:hypothetical protein